MFHVHLCGRHVVYLKQKKKRILDFATKLIKFAFIFHSLWEWYFNVISPQERSPTRSKWCRKCNSDLYYKFGFILECVWAHALGWHKPERSPSLFFLLHLLQTLFLSSVDWIPFAKSIKCMVQCVCVCVYGIALWVRWHRTHNNIRVPYRIYHTSQLNWMAYGVLYTLYQHFSISNWQNRASNCAFALVFAIVYVAREKKNINNIKKPQLELYGISSG